MVGTVWRGRITEASSHERTSLVYIKRVRTGQGESVSTLSPTAAVAPRQPPIRAGQASFS